MPSPSSSGSSVSSSAAEAPLALLGYAPAAAAALREVGLLALSLPSPHPAETVTACQVLGFTGALLAPGQSAAAPAAAWLAATQADSEAVRAGRVDAVAFAGRLGGAAGLGAVAAQGTFAFADALADAVEASGFTPQGAGLLILGQKASDMTLAAPIARLGFGDIGLAAESAPEAERVRRALPAAPRMFPVSRRDDAVRALADRSDLIVLTAGELPRNLLQPYHLLLDLTGRYQAGNVTAHVLTLEDLAGHHLSRQLLHATGKKYAPADLRALAEVLRRSEV